MHMSLFGNAKRRAATVAELWQFLWERKLWWLAPPIAVLLLLGLLLLFSESSVVAPFIYTLF